VGTELKILQNFIGVVLMFKILHFSVCVVPKF